MMIFRGALTVPASQRARDELELAGAMRLL